MLQQWQALADQRSRHKRELYLQVGLEMLSQLTKLTCCVFIPQQWNYENNGIKCFWPLFDDPVLTCLGFNKGELRDPSADSGDLTFQQVGDVNPETSCALRLMGGSFFPCIILTRCWYHLDCHSEATCTSCAFATVMSPRCANRFQALATIL